MKRKPKKRLAIGDDVEPNTVQHVRLPDRLVADIEKHAKKNFRSWAGQLRMILETWAAEAK